MGDRRLTNEEVHNLYGYMMTKSASLGLKKHLGKRHVLISRASSIGMHRYGGLWTGDNSSWWSHLS
jgi:alpha-glucosidase